jgi:predicted phosphoribosyltransferase
MGNLFRDRRDAGRKLAATLTRYSGSDALVLALPRGGVPVAYEVARALGLPLDVFLVRKLGVPGQEELAMGAIASGGIRVVNEEVVRVLGLSAHVLDIAEERERRVLETRSNMYRAGRPAPRVEERTVILVDDGLATGSSMKAAVAALRLARPGRIVVAVPLAPEETLRELEADVDEVVCVASPEPFWGVGRWYDSFPQTSDDEVQKLLGAANADGVPLVDEDGTRRA